MRTLTVEAGELSTLTETTGVDASAFQIEGTNHIPGPKFPAATSAEIRLALFPRIGGLERIGLFHREVSAYQRSSKVCPTTTGD
jgi:hypothetical protein